MRKRKGFSLIELMIVMAIILIIAAIAIPAYQHQLMLGNETATIAQIKTIQAMQAQYYSQFGRYAANLTELGPPPAGAGLIPKSLAGGTKSGYAISVSPSHDGYVVSAEPTTFGSTGRRTFYSDQAMAVHHNWSREPADANSPDI